MTRLRAITERDLLADAAAKLEAGEEIDFAALARQQALGLAIAGRAALNDALDREDEADAEYKRICGG